MGSNLDFDWRIPSMPLDKMHTPATEISVFALEAQPVAARGLAAFIGESPGFTWAGSATSINAALDRMKEEPATVAMVDNSVGMRPSLQFVADLKQMAPTTMPVLWVHDMSEVDSVRVIQMGARGVFKKTNAQGSVWLANLDKAEPTHFRASMKLTPREREIAQCICRGLRNREIGERLAITPGTVKVHLMHIFEKTGVKDRFELALRGRQILGVQNISAREENLEAVGTKVDS
jgi:two-component system nitrate/nitrite response regulator NarL